MSYLVLARKWRPQGFEDLVGQAPITRVLENSIKQDKLAHAYIFSGPRGVGKTSTARILAKAINCKDGPTTTPCGSCPSCSSILTGSSMDVIEIDGASNNSVEDIRELREQVKYAPSEGRYKVYIIDEAHMLSSSAFNALLKTLEEPPPHVVFVLATTLAKKIPLTVLSRCQHLPFRKIPTQKIKERLRLVAEAEGINISEGSLDILSRAADGSMRDSMTILDQVTSLGDVQESDIKELLGVADFGSLHDMARAVIQADRDALLLCVKELVEAGTDLRTFARELTKFVRDLLVCKTARAPEEILDASQEETSAMQALVADTPADLLMLMLSETINAEPLVATASHPRVALEMALLKASFLSSLTPVKEAIEALGGGGGGGGGGNPSSGQKKSLATPPAPSVPPALRAQKKKPVAPPTPEPIVLKEETEAYVAADPASQDSLAPTDSSSQDSPAPADPASPDSSDSPDSLPPPLPESKLSEPPEPAELLSAIMEKIPDPRVSAKLANATPEFSANTLTLAFSRQDAEICAAPLKENLDALKQAASDVRGGAPTDVIIKTIGSRKSSKSRKTLQDKALSEPLVKDVLDLFEGAIVSISPNKGKINSKNGGSYV